MGWGSKLLGPFEAYNKLLQRFGEGGKELSHFNCGENVGESKSISTNLSNRYLVRNEGDWFWCRTSSYSHLFWAQEVDVWGPDSSHPKRFPSIDPDWLQDATLHSEIPEAAGLRQTRWSCQCQQSFAFFSLFGHRIAVSTSIDSNDSICARY